MNRHKEIAGVKRHLTGWMKDRPDHRDLSYKVSFWRSPLLPTICVIPDEDKLKVEDQGSIGSCTCNSGTTGTEYAFHREGEEVQLSRLYAYAKVRSLEGTPLTEDSGAQIRDVMKALAQWGCPLEKDWPYDLTKWQESPPEPLDIEALKYRLTMYYRCPTLITILASIAEGFPVVGGFTCYESMFTDDVTKTGIIPFPKPEEGVEGGHAIIFTGYNRNTKLLRFMNSWGTGWGDKGFGYLPFDYVEKNLASDFWTQRRVVR